MPPLRLEHVTAVGIRRLPARRTSSPSLPPLSAHRPCRCGGTRPDGTPDSDDVGARSPPPRNRTTAANRLQIHSVAASSSPLCHGMPPARPTELRLLPFAGAPTWASSTRQPALVRLGSASALFLSPRLEMRTELRTKLGCERTGLHRPLPRRHLHVSNIGISSGFHYVVLPPRAVVPLPVVHLHWLLER
uniref:Uncharacterized protein n=1 Tax=Oryza glumipatula TaxID=40148 RepID=A0A0E0B828_9ORYZ